LGRFFENKIDTVSKKQDQISERQEESRSAINRLAGEVAQTQADLQLTKDPGMPGSRIRRTTAPTGWQGDISLPGWYARARHPSGGPLHRGQHFVDLHRDLKTRRFSTVIVGDFDPRDHKKIISVEPVALARHILCRGE
jgi:hypothetical protein